MKSHYGRNSANNSTLSEALPRGSHGHAYPLQQLDYLSMYMCAKFGAVNRRIKENRSYESEGSGPVQVRPPLFSIPLISQLLNLSEMFTRLSRIVKDDNSHASLLAIARAPSPKTEGDHDT